MICPYSKNEINVSEQFCPKCGQKLIGTSDSEISQKYWKTVKGDNSKNDKEKADITLRLRPPYCKRFLNAGLAAADMRELVAENQHTAAQFLKPFRYGRDSAGNQRSQLFHFRFQLPQQLVIRLDLPVDLTAVRNNAFPLQCPCVTPSWMVGCSPRNKLFLAVPAFRDGILPAVACALGMLVRTDKPLRLGRGWRHVDLLFTNLVGILFLTAFILRRLELCGSESPCVLSTGSHLWSSLYNMFDKPTIYRSGQCSLMLPTRPLKRIAHK